MKWPLLALICISVVSAICYTPDIVSDASFEGGSWNGFTDNSAGTPTGVTISTAEHYGAGTSSVERVLDIRGWNITNFTAASPTVVFAVGSNFSDGQRMSIFGTTDNALNGDFYGQVTTGSTTLSATSTGYARTAGSFISDGFVPGMLVFPSGFPQTASGVVSSVTALTLDITGGRQVAAAASGRTLTVNGLRFAKRIDADHFAVYKDVSLQTPVTSAGGSGGYVTPGDANVAFNYPFYFKNGQNGYTANGQGVDRLYSRFWFKVDKTYDVNTILKFQMYQHAGYGKFAEFAFFQNYFGYSYVDEWQGGGIRIVPLSAINDGNWHEVESDVQFNGNIDAGGDYISTKLWLDGVDVSIAAPPIVGGIRPGPVTLGAWVNGRLNAGSRSAGNVGKKIGVWTGTNILNQNNRVPGHVWFDNISISTLGPITCISAPVDTTPPILSAGSPSGTLPVGTASALMNITTNENATCRYSTNANTPYANMNNTFSTTGVTTHSTAISGFANGDTYNYYVRCNDTSSNVNTQDYAVTFSVNSYCGAPDVINSASFENGQPDIWNGFLTGALQSPPTGVTRDNTVAYSGASSVIRTIAKSGWNITAVTNAVPPVITTIGSPNFASGTLVGIASTGTSLDSSISNNNRYVKRIDADHFEVYSDAALSAPLAAPGNGISTGVVGTPDVGAAFNWWVSRVNGLNHTAATTNRLWSKFYFKTDVDWSGSPGLKFQNTYDDTVAGAGFALGRLGIGGLSNGISPGKITYVLPTETTNLAYLVNGVTPNVWHSWETDLDVSGNPSAAFWYDGVQINSTNAPVSAPYSWVNGRLTAGTRGASLPGWVSAVGQIGIWEALATLNSGQLNSGSIWIDNVSISTLGRIDCTNQGVSQPPSPPSITNLTRDVGSTTGGTTLVINGANFTAQTTVTFGGVSASGVTLLSPTQLRVTTPAHAVGSVNVVVTDSGQSATLTNGFEYAPAPTITYASSDFENGLLAPFTTWGGSGVVVSTAVARSGTRSVRGDAPANDQTGHSIDFDFASYNPTNPSTANANGVYTRWYAYVPQSTFNSVALGGQIKMHVARLYNAVGVPTGAWLMCGIGPEFGSIPTNQLVCFVDNGIFNIGPQNKPILAGDTWYEMQTWYKRDAVNHVGYAKMWVNGKLTLSTSHANLGDDNLALYLGIPFGLDYTQHVPGPMTIYTDDAAIANGYIEITGSTLSPPSQRPGDLNDDLRVDFNDMLIIIGEFRHAGAAITNTRADLNSDGVINLYDFILTSKHWGKTYP